MSFFQDVSFKNAGSDLINYLREEREHNWLYWIAACIPPAIMVIAFQTDAVKKSTPPPRAPIYFESWPANRSLEETHAAQAALKARKDEFARKQRERYKALGRATGMDVDRIEREAMAEKAAAEKAAEEAPDKQENKTAGAAK